MHQLNIVHRNLNPDNILVAIDDTNSSDIAFSSTGMRDEIIQSLFNVLISAQTSPDWHQRLNAQEILELRDQFMLHPDEIIDNYIASR
ncbi:unnamed protein product [Oppiella nova]|uniref:Protein kinase domain-containing protein n=1 Tax=Oppiella nova TaxID=334625 RepID=A0A7R9QJG4_9ACAR|nr:unnamed protein product [Oppiella nova]CAG2167061.1 unnamed protein product [Oppiella nova]